MGTNRKLLADAEIGDTLIITSWRARHFSKVSKVSKAYVYCGGSRYSKATGYCVGNNYYSAEIATEEEIKQYKAEKKYKELVCRVQKIDFTKVPEECLKRVLAVVNECINKTS